MVLFKAEHVEKQYANHLALNDVSIAVNEGNIFGLLGPNGAGKTTLIRIINQITAPDKGEIYFDGRQMKSEDIYKIGYLPEERGLYKKMKVGEQALYLAQLKGVSKSDALKKLKYWFEKFEIQAWWDKKVEELSKGMQQKIQFVTTVLHEPKLLIFDEPFSGFDPINTELLKKEILELREKGATIIFSTHNMESVEELCDDITLINNAKGILNGSVKDIKDNYKSNIFEIKLKDFKGIISVNSGFELLEEKEEHGNKLISVKVPENKSPNELIQHITSFGTVVSFNEKIPRMNEIFIQVVKETNSNNLLN
jgi:ABC-2 type transport system ATP-binding protein